MVTEMVLEEYSEEIEGLMRVKFEVNVSYAEVALPFHGEINCPELIFQLPWPSTPPPNDKTALLVRLPIKPVKEM